MLTNRTTCTSLYEAGEVNFRGKQGDNICSKKSEDIFGVGYLYCLPTNVLHQIFFNKHFWKDVTYYVFRSKVNQSKTSFRAPCMSMVTKGERAKVKMALSENHT